MAALDKVGPSRKRIATYGKAGRKRQLGQDAFKAMADADTRPGSSRALLSTYTATEAGNANSLRPLSSKPPIAVQMSRHASENDVTIAIPQKRKKLVKKCNASKRTTSEQENGMSRRSFTDAVAKDPPRNDLFQARDGLTRQESQRRETFKLIPKARSPAKNKKSTMPAGITAEGQSIPETQLLVSGAETDLDGEVIRPKPGVRSMYPAIESLANYSSQMIHSQDVDYSACRKSISPLPAAGARLSTPRKSTPLDDGVCSVGSSPSMATILSPHGMKIWDELLGNSTGDKRETSDSEGSIDRRRYLERDHRASLIKDRPPRRRLIDSLTEQSGFSHIKVEALSTLDDRSSTDLTSDFTSQTSDRKTLHPADLATNATASQKLGTIGLAAGAEQISQVSGPKITYSRQRSMLAEQDLNEGMSFDLTVREPLATSKSLVRRGSTPVLIPLQTPHEANEVHQVSVGGAIRTIHELRQAGAESRFKDEVEDLLDRIGIPTQQPSGRRLALMEFASRMTDKAFYSRFLSHGIDRRLFLYLGHEQDVISGFMLISLLIVVLDSGSTPVTAAQLRQQGITRLIIRLIGLTTSIITIAKDKDYNMSKSAQAMLSEQHRNFLKLRVWDGIRPPSISPRTASLRCLELIAHHNREAGNAEDKMSKELIGELFAVLEARCDGKPTAAEDYNSRLALSTLESHSLYPSMDLEDRLPIIKNVLESTLKDDPENPAVAPLLRLVLNATDNSPTASNLFASSKFLHLMCHAIVDKFRVLSTFVTEGDRQTLVDHLVLMLIVLINTTELSEHSRRCFQTLHETSINDLALIFIEYNEKSFEAKSVEESQLNVASGYLAVFLGFLSLNPEIGNRIAMTQKTKTLWPLIACIDEFISHHKRVDDLLKNETDHRSQAGLTDRLERLVERLKGSQTNHESL